MQLDVRRVEIDHDARDLGGEQRILGQFRVIAEIHAA
jgi:hypothetical protein